jgi:hypothetical protein
MKNVVRNLRLAPHFKWDKQLLLLRIAYLYAATASSRDCYSEKGVSGYDRNEK